MLNADEASEIARAAGLGIADAVALQALADDTETATRIAARFAGSDDRRVARDLFGRADTEVDPTEGEAPATTTTTTTAADQEVAAFVAGVFGTNPSQETHP